MWHPRSGVVYSLANKKNLLESIWQVDMHLYIINRIGLFTILTYTPQNNKRTKILEREYN